MNKEIKKRIKIADAAATCYLKNPCFTIQSLADTLNMDPSEIFDLFPNRSSILRYFYTSRFVLIEELTSEIPDYSSFSVSEKLSHLFLSLVEQFGEHREFVLKTYPAMILRNFSPSGFEKEFRKAIQSILQSDPKISSVYRIIPNAILHRLFTVPLTGIIYFWMNDKSREYEDTLALVDKWASFTEELLYSHLADKGLDLARFLFYKSPFNRCMTHKHQEPAHE